MPPATVCLVRGVSCSLPFKETGMYKHHDLHHVPARDDDATWTVSDAANLLRMAAAAARYWRDSGRSRHA